MAVGEAIEGTVTAIEASTTYEGAYFLFLENDGAVTRVFTSGKLSYNIKDGLITVGNTYRITRLADLPAKKKGSKGMTNFQVQVDRSSAKKALPAI